MDPSTSPKLIELGIEICYAGGCVGLSVRTIVQTVLTATFNSYGDRQISTTHKIDTTEPIDRKLGTVDYIRERTSYAKFGTNTGTRGFWANGEI